MQNKSFTLIELLVVIVIIGILAGVIIVSVSSSINKANFAKAQSFSNTVQNELLGDLVSEWTFDNSSNPGEDTWGNNDGTVYGSPVLATKEECVHGTCLIFDGVNDYITSSNILDGETKATISLYVKKKDISRHISCGEAIDSHLNSRIELIWYTDGNIYFEVGTDHTVYVRYNPNIKDLNWHLITATYDGSKSGNYDKMKVYFDGKLLSPSHSSGTIASSISTGVTNFFMGTRNGTYSYGLIDDLRLYNTALSSAQIKKQYVAGLDSLLANGSIGKEEYAERLNSLAQK